MGYCEVDQEFADMLITNQVALTHRKEVDYPHGSKVTLSRTFLGHALFLQDVMGLVKYVFKKGPLTKT